MPSGVTAATRQASEWLAEAPVLTWMERLSTEQEA
jgi:hypothetical protein